MQARCAGLLAAALLLAVPCRADDTVLEILTVRNRPAESLVADLAPLAGPNGAVTASGSKLIVRATPSALADIKRALAALDVAPRSLLVRVRQADASRQSVRRAQASGRVDAQGGRTRTVVTGAFAQQDESAGDETEQSLRVLEGLPAYISFGQSAATPVSLQEAQTGFWVLPRLAGGQVTLELATSKEAFNARGGVDSQRLVTTLSGRLGEWLSVGGLSRSGASGTSAPGASARGDAAEARVVRILVEEVR